MIRPNIAQLTFDDIAVVLTAAYQNGGDEYAATDEFLHTIAVYCLDASIGYHQLGKTTEARKAYKYYFIISEVLRENGYYSKRDNNTIDLPNVPFKPVND